MTEPPGGTGGSRARRAPGEEEAVGSWFELVAPRTLVDRSPRIRLPLSLGDEVFVAAGDSVQPGLLLAERLRHAHLEEHGRRGQPFGHEKQITVAGHEWFITGGQRHPLESPATGIVRSVDPTAGLAIDVSGNALHGVLAVGGPSRGRLEIATGADGELRPAAVDVGRAGTILVVGSRVAAETLTRARAMGVRGVIVGALSGKDQRDFEASERRQRASVHHLASFAVLVLDGVLRRPISSPAMKLLETLEGSEVAIVGDPPALLFQDPKGRIPEAPPGWVRARSGPMAGREGHWLGPAGQRRFGAAMHLEAGFVRFGEGAPTPVPLADLERLV